MYSSFSLPGPSTEVASNPNSKDQKPSNVGLTNSLARLLQLASCKRMISQSIRGNLRKEEEEDEEEQEDKEEDEAAKLLRSSSRLSV